MRLAGIKIIVLTTCVLLRNTINTYAQSYQSLDTLKPKIKYENVYVVNVSSDSLVSSFVIFIKKEVKAHKHFNHSEHVYVLEGKGVMTLGNKIFNIKKGDLIFIPKNTVHSVKVTSGIPLKVVSIQAPFFDGKDRIISEY